METPRRDIILKKYVKVYNYAPQHFEGVFPNPLEVGVPEVLLVLSTYFTPYSPDYKKPLTKGLRVMGLKLGPEDFELHCSVTYDDLHDLRLFIKNQR
jgi:hypothetical protein